MVMAVDQPRHDQVMGMALDGCLRVGGYDVRAWPDSQDFAAAIRDRPVVDDLRVSLFGYACDNPAG